MNLGKTINMLRKEKGISQGDMASMANITQSYLSLLENNRKDASVDTLEKIAGILDIPLPVLFFLSLDENDIADKKKDLYQTLKPYMTDMVNKLFLDHDNPKHDPEKMANNK